MGDRPRRACSSASTSPPPPMPGDRRPNGGHVRPRADMACLPCWESRIKCDGKVPCSGCFERCRPCRPKGERALMDGVMHAMDPHEAAALYIEAFRAVHREGAVDRRKAIAVLKEWSLLSRMAGGQDVSWGVAMEVIMQLKIRPGDVTDELTPGMPEAERQAAAQAVFQRQMQEGQALKASPHFQFLDDGARGVFMVAFRDGHFIRATNAAYERLTSGVTEGYARAVDKGTLPSLVMACQVAPEDRFDFLVQIVRIMFTNNFAGRTLFIKAQTRRATIRVLMLKVTEFAFDGEQAAVVTLEAVPTHTTKYVTERPGRLCRIYAFREKTEEESEDDEEQERQHEETKGNGGSSGGRRRGGNPSALGSGADTAGTGGSAPLPLPALACVGGTGAADVEPHLLSLGLQALQTAEGRAMATALFAPKQPLPPEEEGAPVGFEPPPLPKPPARLPRRRSSRPKRTEKQGKAWDSGEEETSVSQASAPSPPPPPAPAEAAEKGARRRRARRVAQREAGEGAALPPTWESPPALPPLPFVGSMGAAAAGPPAAVSSGGGGDGQDASRGATGSGSIAQGGLRVNVNMPAPAAPGYGRTSPVDAGQLWALQSPGVCLRSPPVLTDEIFALFDFEEGGGEWAGAGQGQGQGHTGGV